MFYSALIAQSYTATGACAPPPPRYGCSFLYCHSNQIYRFIRMMSDFCYCTHHLQSSAIVARTAGNAASLTHSLTNQRISEIFIRIFKIYFSLPIAGSSQSFTVGVSGSGQQHHHHLRQQQQQQDGDWALVILTIRLPDVHVHVRRRRCRPPPPAPPTTSSSE